MKTPEQQRQYRKRKAELENRTVRAYKKRNISATSVQEWRREYKRVIRLESGCKPRSEKIAESELKTAKKEAVKLEKMQLKSLHDAHVMQYFRVMKARQRAATKYKTQPEKEKQRSRKYKSRLPDAYVVQALVLQGVSKEKISPRIVDLKREQMTWRRLSLQLKQAVHKHHKEIYEAITKHT